MSKELSADAVLVSRAIAAMDKLIAKGWTYSWFASYDKEGKRACLGGALSKRNWGGRRCKAETVSDIAHDMHIALEHDGWLGNGYTNYRQLRTALLAKYDLVDHKVLAA